VRRVTVVNTVQIDCSPEEAFAYVADVTTHPGWSLDPIQVEVLTPGVQGVGARYQTIGNSLMLQGPSEAELEVVEFNSPRRFSFIAHGQRDFRHDFTFEATEGGTQVSRAMTYDIPPAMMERAAAMESLLDQRRDAGLNLLKARLEGLLIR
jgi:hypothetical protein